MVRDAAERLSKFVLREAGDGLRTIIVMMEDDYEVIYLRDDLQDTYTNRAFSEVVETFRLKEPFLSPTLDTRPIGERRAILHYHENAVIIQFPYSNAETILISLSQDSGRDLVGFIEACRRIVHQNSDHSHKGDGIPSE